ncbi:MAG: hypothetical protein JWN04_3573 [Myxococcaceae bacterium]|nr:hypothetical protein [Myxococcaceae bacterium]
MQTARAWKIALPIVALTCASALGSSVRGDEPRKLEPVSKPVGAVSKDATSTAVAAVAPPPHAANGAPHALHAARVPQPISIDAKMEHKRVWDSDSGGTGVFRDPRGDGMVPYSEARVRWDQDHLYLWLYAGDLDLQARTRKRDGDLRGDDAFHVEIAGPDSRYVIEVSLLGTVYDAACPRALAPSDPLPRRACQANWQSKAQVAVDRDGSLNRIHDNDEEWLVELSLPLASVGLANAAGGSRIPFSVRRCEVGFDGRHACGGWGLDGGSELVLDP